MKLVKDDDRLTVTLLVPGKILTAFQKEKRRKEVALANEKRRKEEEKRLREARIEREAKERLKAAKQLVQKMVDQKNTSGFGFLKRGNFDIGQTAQSVVCTNLDDPVALERVITESQTYTFDEDKSVVVVKENPNKIFRKLKLGRCDFVASDGEILSLFMAGLRRDEVDVELMLDWFSKDEIKKARSALDREARKLAEREAEEAPQTSTRSRSDSGSEIVVPWYAKQEYWDHEITLSELKRRAKGLSYDELQDIALCARLTYVSYQRTKQRELLKGWGGLTLFLALGLVENGYDKSIGRTLNIVANQELESLGRSKNRKKADEIGRKCAPLSIIGVIVGRLSEKYSEK